MNWQIGTVQFLRAHLGDFGARTLGGVLSLPALMLGFWLLERLRPLSADRARLTPTDLKYYLANPFFDALTRVAAVACMLGWVALLGWTADPRLLHGFGPVIRQPQWLIWIEMLVLLELSAYGCHRMFHQVPWLWRFHAVHHSSTNLTWLSAVRRHPFNDVVTAGLNSTLLFALGFPIDASMQLLPLIAMHALLTHGNLDWRFGPFSGWIVSPIYHRFHHTLGSEGGHKNFAALFPIVDKLFGTYYMPDRAPGAVGVDGHPLPEGFLGQLAYPFVPQSKRAAADAAKVEGV